MDDLAEGRTLIPQTVRPSAPPYDPVMVRAAAIFLHAFDRAHPRRPNREWDGCCEECWGDGCKGCRWTGYVA